MSYGIGIVIPKEDLVKEKIRFSTCDWMLPIHVIQKVIGYLTGIKEK
jgi:hypothetical protein